METKKTNTVSGIFAGIQISILIIFVGMLIAVEAIEMQDSGVFFKHLASLLLLYLFGPIVVGLEAILFFIKFLVFPKPDRIITAIRITDGIFGLILVLSHVWSMVAPVADEYQIFLIVLLVIIVALFFVEALVRGIPKLLRILSDK
ncbi:MAG: hypothetical protein IJZ83_05865 [Clostridia bacterium]|nr:hypothetical protein [Clostridia bacterium]